MKAAGPKIAANQGARINRFTGGLHVWGGWSRLALIEWVDGSIGASGEEKQKVRGRQQNARSSVRVFVKMETRLTEPSTARPFLNRAVCLGSSRNCRSREIAAGCDAA